MATNRDWQVLHTTMLYKLLMLREKSDNGTISAKDLNEFIGEIMASMTNEDIAHVKSKVAEQFQ